MPARHRGFGDLERVAVVTADGDPFLAQFMDHYGQRSVDDDKFGHVT
jgi:hypothetical protein